MMFWYGLSTLFWTVSCGYLAYRILQMDLKVYPILNWIDQRLTEATRARVSVRMRKGRIFVTSVKSDRTQLLKLRALNHEATVTRKNRASLLCPETPEVIRERTLRKIRQARGWKGGL